MIELYFNDANLLPENREEEQYAEATLNNILAGKTADTEMCILPCFYDALLHKGLLYHQRPPLLIHSFFFFFFPSIQTPFSST